MQHRWFFSSPGSESQSFWVGHRWSENCLANCLPFSAFSSLLVATHQGTLLSLLIHADTGFGSDTIDTKDSAEHKARGCHGHVPLSLRECSMCSSPIIVMQTCLDYTAFAHSAFDKVWHFPHRFQRPDWHPRLHWSWRQSSGTREHSRCRSSKNNMNSTDLCLCLASLKI